MAFPLRLAGMPTQGDGSSGSAIGGQGPAPRPVAVAQAEGVVGRPAPAGGDRPRDRARRGGVPVRRAALQPRCQAAGRHAAGDQETARELGTTMIYVTHDQVEAMTMADKIVVLRAGRLEQVGSAARSLQRPPRNKFRGGVHRLAQDEPHRGSRSGKARLSNHRHRPEHIGPSRGHVERPCRRLGTPWLGHILLRARFRSVRRHDGPLSVASRRRCRIRMAMLFISPPT